MPTKATLPEHPLSSDALYTKTEARIQEALEQLVEFSIDPQPLKDAIDFVRTRYQIPILFDTKALEGAGIDTSTEVTIQTVGIKLRGMLTLLLGPLNLSFDVRDEVLMITTQEAIRERMVVVVYDCRDLVRIRSIEVSEPARKWYEGQKLEASEPKETMQDSGEGPVAEASKKPATATSPKAEVRKGRPAKRLVEHKKAVLRPAIPLIHVIQNATDPENWSADGGERSGTITEFGGLLVVRHNPLIHEQIRQVLADFRRIKKEGAFSSWDRAQPAATSLP